MPEDTALRKGPGSDLRNSATSRDSMSKSRISTEASWTSMLGIESATALLSLTFVAISLIYRTEELIRDAQAELCRHAC
jgi:hypothetical protein